MRLEVLGSSAPLGTQTSSELSAGDWVEVRSREEILATLDQGGRLDELPFMPQMFDWCGKRFRVWKRAHKTCDTVHKTGGRRMPHAVHLEELRCDGKAYGGCEAACLLFWKDAWLRPVAGPAMAEAAPAGEPAPSTDAAPKQTALGQAGAAGGPGGCTAQDVIRGTRAPGDTNDLDPTYVCQATLLPKATTLLPWWDLRQYWEDYRSGNSGVDELLGGAIYVGYFALARPGGRVRRWLSPPLVSVYERWQRLTGGVQFPRRVGAVPAGQKTPAGVALDLKPGELVRVKSYAEILTTLDGANKNRGLYFDAEEVPYCGKTFRVRSLVRQILDEKTGRMLRLKGNNVILEGVYCKGWYSDRRMFCPRAIYSIWREAWLERAEQPISDAG
jgi:hypothetical protein